MANIDKQKEWIGFLKTSFFFLLASIFGIFSFEFLHYKVLNQLELILINILLVIFVIVDIIILLKLFKEIEKLKDM